MIFSEWADKYDYQSACRQFRTSDHMIIVIHPKRYVVSRCGGHVASEPLGLSQSVELAISKLVNAMPVFKTMDILTHDNTSNN